MARCRAKRKPMLIDQGTPTIERLRHGPIEERREMGAVTRQRQAPLARYLKRGDITARQHNAGERLVIDYELGIIGARDPEARGGSGPPTPISIAQLMATQGFQLAVKALGKRLADVVLPICCAEMGVGDYARYVGSNPRHVMGQLKIGLDMLGDHYRL